MGTYHYAVVRETKRAVEIGKTHWDCLDGKSYETKAQLSDVVLEHVKDGFYSKDTQTREFADFMAEELWKAGNTFEVVSASCARKSDYDGYTIVGSMYTDPGSRTYVGNPLSDYLYDDY